MTLYKFIFSSLSVLCLAQCTYAQTASGVLSPGRSIDWSQAGVQGGIPSRTTQCGSTIAPYSGSAATINTAIANCPAGQFVKLGAGTFNLSSGIDFAMKNNVTVRGSGADQTLVVFTGGASCNGLSADVCLAGGNSGPGGENHVANWTSGYSRGATQLTLSNSSGIVANSTLINLDQLDESSDTGSIWNCLTTGVCATEGGGGFARGGNRSQQAQVLVTGCSPSCNSASSTVVTISPGLYMPNWSAAKSPQAWWANVTLAGSGIEDVSMDHQASSASQGVTIMNCYQCYVKGVRSLYSGRSHVWLYESSHSTIRDSYFFENRSHMSVSYGIEISPASSDNLIENNIFERTTDSNPNNNGGSQGNVVGYNYTVSTSFNGSGWFQASDYQHASGSAFWLREGNVGPGFAADNVHGTHHFTTLFRNYYAGQQASCGGSPCTAQTIAVHLYAGTRYFNVIGNVLGTSGYHNSYQSLAPNGTNGHTSIFTLGWTGNGGGTNSSITGFCSDFSCSSRVSYDSLTYNTLMRWGNYDTVNNAARWQASEVPSGLSLYANAVPASQSLPPSFYLPSKPAWWGSGAWPAVGPDVSGGGGPGGHANAIPAQTCYSGLSTDSKGARIFSASRCYYSGSTTPPPPVAPTNLITTVQ